VVVQEAPRVVSLRAGQRRTRPARSKVGMREKAVATVMALPVIVPFLVFAVVPLGWLIWEGLTDDNGFTHANFIGLANYRELYHDPQWWQSVTNSAYLAVGSLVIQVPLGIALAIILNRKIRGSGIFRTVFFLPYVIPISVMGVVFGFLFNPVGGVVDSALRSVGLTHSPTDVFADRTSAMLTIIGVNIWAEFGFTMILTLAALQAIPRELYESARLDGANVFQQSIYVTLPMIRPVLNVIFMLGIVDAMRSFDLVKTLTNGGPAGASDVMFTHIYNLFFGTDTGAQPRIGYGSAQAVVASALIGLAVGGYFLLARRALYGSDGPSQ
jgi:raffinose/stachyose/melibiose transport system permease protein